MHTLYSVSAHTVGSPINVLRALSDLRYKYTSRANYVRPPNVINDVSPGTRWDRAGCCK